MQLKLKEVIKWAGEAGFERILCYHPAGQHFYCITLDGNNAWPFTREIAKVTEAVKLGTAVVVRDDPWAMTLRPEAALTQRHREMRDNAYDAIKELVEDNRRLVYDRRTSGSEIRRAATSRQLHVTTIYKYLRRYWQRGAVPNALQPDLSRCGGRGKSKTCGSLKLGDVNNNGEHVGINVTPDVKTAFAQAIDKYYETEKRYPFTMVYEMMLADSFASGYSVKNGVLSPDIKPAAERPTFAQFRYFYDKNYRKIKSLRKRMGANYVEQNCSGVMNDQTKSASGVGDIYQIDATTADAYLVLSDDPDITVGRPVVYLVIDTFSQLVTGLHVTFFNMSFNAAAMAIWNAYTDKVVFCKEIGIPEVNPAHWPAKGLPHFLYADRGELISKASDQAVENVGIQIINAAAYCPTAKAIVERHFGLLNDSVIKWLPGAVPDEMGGPRRGDYRKKAALTKEEFLRALVHAILAYNTSTRPDYKLTPAMKADHVEPIPCKIWEWGMRNNPHLHNKDPRMVRLGLLPVADGKILSDGIKVGSLRFTCAKARIEQWFDSQKAFNNSWEIKCTYDPNLVDHVFLLGNTFDETQICDLTPAYHDFSRWTWVEVEAYRKHQGAYMKAKEHDDYQAEANALAAIKQIVSRAEDRRQQNGPADASQISTAQERQQMRDGQSGADKTLEIVGAEHLNTTPLVSQLAKETKISEDWLRICRERKENHQQTKNNGHDNTEELPINNGNGHNNGAQQ